MPTGVNIPLKIESVTLYHVQMRLKDPVTTSFGAIKKKDAILVAACDHDGIVGWGETPVFAIPWYQEETIDTAWHVLSDFLIPRVLQQPFVTVPGIVVLFAPVQRNYMAKAGLEGALWDLAAKRQGCSLAALLGGKRRQVPVGVVVGLKTTETELLHKIAAYQQAGYQKIKLKIKPGQDHSVIAAVRKVFPLLSLAVDANGAYKATDAFFDEVDQWQLTMIEQPLAPGDLLGHSNLQARLKTPLCLDESIASFHDIELALALKSCQIINIKLSRIGGLSAAKAAHDLCASQRIPVWCGGMFETGVGRAHNIALASLDGFTLPGDLSASERYWDFDIIEPEVTVHQGEVVVPTEPGIGFGVSEEKLKKVTLAKAVYS
ncbi:MAG: o-succinylbenzoate synthase [Sporomusaceae bacterium]|nr:o-succinylbenzoate synthase [Sporomusaceae bacterium]